MNKQWTVAAGANRRGEGFRDACVIVAAVATLLLVLPAVAAEQGASGSAGKSATVKLESVPGSTVKRVILTARAAERLGIATGKVSEELIVRKQMVSGLIIPPMDKQTQPRPPSGGFGGFGRGAAAPKGAGGFGDFGRAPAAPAPQPVAERTPLPVPGEVWVLVSLSPHEWERLAKDKPARLLPLGTREKLVNEILAQPSGMEPLEDTKRSMLSLYYVVPGKDHGLTMSHRMRVELQLSGSEEKQKVVPYGSVYYDAKGTAWVYVSSVPLTFERQRIAVDRVVGDLAVLTEGPPVGTTVVTVGAALLYGSEIFGK